jgi:hypothetical protein
MPCPHQEQPASREEMVCPFCSEEHPVTVDTCPLTGKQLREPLAVDALPVREERVSFPSLLAEAARLYRRNFVAFAVTTSVVFVPFAALQTWSTLRFAASSPAADATRITMRASQEHRRLSTDEQARIQRAIEAARPQGKRFLLGMVAALMLIPLFIGAQILSQAALVPLVGDRALGGNMGPGRAWLAVGLHPGAILWTASLSTGATMVGALFCLVPGVLAAIGFSLAMPIVLLEGRSGIDALRRSWRLMRVEWPRVLGLWLVVIAAFAVVMSVMAPIAFRLATDPAAMMNLVSGWRGAVMQISQSVISMLLLPLPVIGTTLVYLHARREQENMPIAELQLQMRRAATGT